MSEPKTYNKTKELVSLIYCGLLLMGSPFYMIIAAEDLGGFCGRAIYLLTAAALYAIPLCLLKKRHFFWLMIPMLGLSLADLIHAVMYKQTSTIMWLCSFLIQEGNEGSELATIFTPFGIGVALLWMLYLVLNYRYVLKRPFFADRTRKIVASAAGGWLVVALLCTVLESYTSWFGAFRTVKKVCPINYVYNYGRFRHIASDIHACWDAAETFRFGATTEAQDDELVVLIIGETSRWRNWQINGYERETNPRLMQRADRLCTFDSCYTIANLTTISVPMMLSRATPLQTDVFFKEPCVVDAFHEAGYSTSWIADQSFRSPLLLNISGRCDDIYYQEHDQQPARDHDLLPSVEEHIRREGKQLLVVHSRGCHFRYSTRYTPEYSHFRPDLNDVDWKSVRKYVDPAGFNVQAGKKSSAVANAVRQIFTNSYDNALRYTECFIDSVIGLLELSGRPAVVMYVADHGENLLDDQEHRVLHGQQSTSIYEYHVPMFVWASDAYMERYPDVIPAMQAHKKSRVSTMNVFHTLLDLGHVEMTDKDDRLSLCSPNLQPDTMAWIIDADLRLGSISTDEKPVGK